MKKLVQKLAVGLTILVAFWATGRSQSALSQDAQKFAICVTQCATENGGVVLGWNLLQAHQDEQGNWIVSAETVDPPQGIVFTVDHRRNGNVLQTFSVRPGDLPVHLSLKKGIQGGDQFWVRSDDPNDVTPAINESVAEDELPWGVAQIVATPQRHPRGGFIYSTLKKLGGYTADTLSKGRIIGKVLLVVFLLGLFGAVLLTWRVFWDPSIHPSALNYWKRRFRMDFEGALRDLTGKGEMPKDRLGLLFLDVLSGVRFEELASTDYAGELDKLQRRLADHVENEAARLTFGVHSSFPGFLFRSKKRTTRVAAPKSTENPKVRAATSWLFSLDSLWGLAVISPLLGLLGTVTGLSDSFRRVSQTPVGSSVPGLPGGAAGNPINVLAGGINEALYTTIAGLASGIVLILVYYAIGYRVNKIHRLMQEAVDTFMDALAHQLEKMKQQAERP